MSVSSLVFFGFIAVLWIIMQSLDSNRKKQWTLLLASYVFYATFGLGFLALLIASSAGNYYLGQKLKRRTTASFLWVCVAANVVFLGVLKYAPQILAVSPASPFAKLLLPIGISFWTFQALSYLFDIYRGEELDPSFLEFCLYMAFWPTVLSGPVTRLEEMLLQFRAIPRAKMDDVSIGVRRIIAGLFLKLVLAQLLANGIRPGEGLDFGFEGMTQHWGALDVWFLALGYGLQLYFDFSGYSHIVIGAARLFGIVLPENFDDPYLASTPSLFWTKWHMTLSFWIRDYLFMPLARFRSGSLWLYASLVASMGIFGLWHGATWTYVLWGCYNGMLLVVHRTLQKLRRQFPVAIPAEGFLSWGLTFASILLGWILFRAQSLSQASTMLRTVFSPREYRHMMLAPNFYLLTAAVAAGYFLFAYLRRASVNWGALVPAARALAPMYYAAAILLIIIFSSQKSVFVYFQF